jgi:hypothetical protein
MMPAARSPYLHIRRLIFVIPDPPLRILIGDWAALRIVYAECGNRSWLFAFGPPPRLSASSLIQQCSADCLPRAMRFRHECLDQVVVIGERRSVDEGISPKTVRGRSRRSPQCVNVRLGSIASFRRWDDHVRSSPDKQTSSEPVGMSQRCQQPTFAATARRAILDILVRRRE